MAEMIAVERRRPLADAQTALRGTDYQPTGEGKEPIRIDGTAFIRRMLEADIVAITETTARLKAARESADGQLRLQVREGDDLESDRRLWQADADAAEQVAERFAARLDEAAGELETVETAVVELGREFAGASALLAGAIDARAPPPRRPPQGAP